MMDVSGKGKTKAQIAAAFERLHAGRRRKK
jgi:hypothetical protein